MINRITIVGTGLIGASVGLALRGAGFSGEIIGVDNNPAELEAARQLGAITRAGTFEDACASDLILLAVPVLSIMDWLERLAPHLKPHQLVTDVGSTKLKISELAAKLNVNFLPGHPMAGKESGGAALAEAKMLEGAMWLFTPTVADTQIATEWRAWVARLGCRTQDLDPLLHDKLCAWVSHMPQMVSTAMAALFEDEFGDAEEIRAVGGRALREMTRLGASPYSMWRDVALTNADAVAATLFALEQRLAHVRENLRTPELREEFRRANAFRSRS